MFSITTALSLNINYIYQTLFTLFHPIVKLQLVEKIFLPCEALQPDNLEV
ncbi:hypothetical protein HY029_00965 [Candidatus Gottesmanbacteria bacterium]|nr:hypothetical protein [Candidatus Gottesmanbacteria bacterium]